MNKKASSLDEAFFYYFRFSLSTSIMVIHNKFEDFIIFLYVHMSRADENYDPKEMATIKEKMKEIFDGEDVEKKLYVAIREYNTFDRAKLNELFKDTFSHFNEDQNLSKNNFLSDLNDIMLADGKVVREETKALEALKGIITLNSAKTK